MTFVNVFFLIIGKPKHGIGHVRNNYMRAYSSFWSLSFSLIVFTISAKPVEENLIILEIHVSPTKKKLSAGAVRVLTMGFHCFSFSVFLDFYLLCRGFFPHWGTKYVFFRVSLAFLLMFVSWTASMPILFFIIQYSTISLSPSLFIPLRLIVAILIFLL